MRATHREAHPLGRKRDVELDLAGVGQPAVEHRQQLGVVRSRLVADHDEIRHTPAIKVRGIATVLPLDAR